MTTPDTLVYWKATDTFDFHFSQNFELLRPSFAGHHPQASATPITRRQTSLYIPVINQPLQQYL